MRFGFEGTLNAIYGFDREPLICEGPFCLLTKPQKFLKLMEMDSELYVLDVIGLCAWILSLWILLYVTVKVKLSRAQ